MLTMMDTAPQKYSPDEYLAVLGPVKALCGKVAHLRAVGLDADSTYRLLALVWEGMTAESVQQAVAGRLGTVRATCPSDFYPTLPGQVSIFDEGTAEDSEVGSSFRPRFAFEDSRVGFHMDEGEAAAARRGRAHSSILPASILDEPVSKKAKGAPGLVSAWGGNGRETAMQEMEKPPDWPEQTEKSSGSSMEMEPFPKLPDEDLQLALLAAYNSGEAVRMSMERFASPERQQGEAQEAQMLGRRGNSNGGVLRRVTGTLQRTISQLHLKGREKTSKE